MRREDTTDLSPGWFAVAAFLEFPTDRQKNSRIPRPNFGESCFRVAVRSRFPSRHFTFFRIPQCILFKSPIPKIPSLQCRRFVQACKSLCSRKRHVDWLEKRGENGASQKERGKGRVGGGEREEKTPIRGSVCQRTKFPQKNDDFGQAHFFLPSPSPLSFFRPSTYPKGYYFYSP